MLNLLIMTFLYQQLYKSYLKMLIWMTLPPHQVMTQILFNCVTPLKLYTFDKLSSVIFCCLWMSECVRDRYSVTPDQISTFSNIYRHKSPILTLYLDSIAASLFVWNWLRWQDPNNNTDTEARCLVYLYQLIESGTVYLVKCFICFRHSFSILHFATKSLLSGGVHSRCSGCRLWAVQLSDSGHRALQEAPTAQRLLRFAEVWRCCQGCFQHCDGSSNHPLHCF